MMDKGRYDNIPLSEKTREGMTLNINDLAAIGRVLSLQDDAFEEQFQNLTEAVSDLKKEVVALRSEVNGLKLQIQEINKTVDCTKREVADIREDVERLKKLNSVWVILLRIGVGVGLALGIVRIIHGKF